MPAIPSRIIPDSDIIVSITSGTPAWNESNNFIARRVLGFMVVIFLCARKPHARSKWWPAKRAALFDGDEKQKTSPQYVSAARPPWNGRSVSDCTRDRSRVSNNRPNPQLLTSPDTAGITWHFP